MPRSTARSVPASARPRRRLLRVVGVYREVASGAADANRPVMSWLLGHVADGAFDAVIIDQFDRLGRDTAQAVGLVDPLALAEVRLVIAAATEEDRVIATTPDPRPVPPADYNDATRVVCDYLTQTRVTYIRALTLVRRDYGIPGQWSKHSPDDPVGALREYGAILVDSPHTTTTSGSGRAKRRARPWWPSPWPRWTGNASPSGCSTTPTRTTSYRSRRARAGCRCSKPSGRRNPPGRRGLRDRPPPDPRPPAPTRRHDDRHQPHPPPRGGSLIPTPEIGPLPATGKRVALYSRISGSDGDEGTSHASQQRLCSEYAEQHGYAVVASEEETQTGAQLYQRKKLSRLRDMLRAGQIDAILALKVERLSRKLGHLHILVEEAKQAGGELLFVLEQLDTSAQGQILMSVAGYAAEIEREQIIERQQRYIDERVRRDKLLPAKGRVQYGYRYAPGTTTCYVPDDPTPEDTPEQAGRRTAPIVRRILRWYADGESCYGIAARLTALGIPTPSGRGRWRQGTIQSYLVSNAAYIGRKPLLRTVRTLLTGRDVPEERRGTVRAVPTKPEDWVIAPETTVPALVDADLWDAVARRRASNIEESRRNNKQPAATLLRGGFVRCGGCGRMLSSINRPPTGARRSPGPAS